MSTQYPRLADPSDIGRLVTGDRVHWSWPPPGTTEQRLGFPETWELIRGDPTEGEPGDWWVTHLEHVAGFIDEDVTTILTQLSKVFTGPIAVFAGTVGNWPVIFEQGKADNYMRWIKSTYRGTLGGIAEQFQFQINWGTPGDDPDFTEAELLTFANDLAARWTTAWADMAGRFSADVVFTEVGAATEIITVATESDGSGGNLSQPFPTQWSTYVTGSRPTGTAPTASLPYEVACALTLQTDTRGPRGRGRLYLPPFSTACMSGGGVYNTATVNPVGAAVGTFLDAVSTANDPLVPVVVSKRAVQLHPVTTVLQGKVPDSQRRRRRSQDELRAVVWTA